MDANTYKRRRQATLSFSKQSFSCNIIKKPISIAENIAGLTRLFIRICPSIISLVERLILVFFLNRSYQEHTLSSAILVDINKRKYPSYRLSLDRKLWIDRNALLLYEEALLLEWELANFLTWAKTCRKSSGPTQLMETPPRNLAVTSFQEFFNEINSLRLIFKASLKPALILPLDRVAGLPECVISHSRSLDYFKSMYSRTWVYHRILVQAISVLESIGEHSQANELIIELLEQYEFGIRKRGKLWHRLIVNSDRHCNAKNLAERYLTLALQDPFVKRGSRRDLDNRAKSRRKKENSLKNSKKKISSSIAVNAETKCYAVDVIDGLRSMPLTSGSRLKFENEWGDVMSVEQIAANHYESLGWRCLHVENSLFATLFTLFFWDILFPQCDDASESVNMGLFYTRFQTAPLDLFSDSFYHDRKCVIEARLLALLNQEFRAVKLKSSYESYYGTLAVGVSWDFLLEDLLEINGCFKGPDIVQVMKMFASNYSDVRKGLPDLVVWDPLGQALFPEFKKAPIKPLKAAKDTVTPQCDDVIDVDSLASSTAVDMSKLRQSNGSSQQSIVTLFTCADEPTSPFYGPKLMLVEVKSLHDHLSTDQSLWLEFLSIECKIQTRLCKVNNYVQ